MSFDDRLRAGLGALSSSFIAAFPVVTFPWLTVSIGILATLSAAPAAAELGWKESDYVKKYGAASHSPQTPEQVRFPAPGGGAVLVVFENGRSREEAFLVDHDDHYIPAGLMRAARAAVKGKPVRRTDFRLTTSPPSEIFEVRQKGVTLQVDYRNLGIVRVAQCRSTKPCVWIDRLIAMERATDDLMARTEEQLRRQHR